MMEELKACPFCGGEADTRWSFDDDSDDEYYYCQCTECKASTDVFYEDISNLHQSDMAKTAWNRRATGWISVDERLPEECTRILLYCDNDDNYPSKEKIVVIGELNRFGHHGEFTSNDEYNVATHRENVTHWMPLPEPPCEDDERSQPK